MSEPARRYDVVVVGGGGAGLSGALTLARARRSVLVIDAGEPRNAPAAHVHGYLSRNGVSPAELLAAGREEVRGHGGVLAEGRVTAARRLPDGDFLVEYDGGPAVLARRLLVATGLVDELPAVSGIADRWGREVLHCPYCHGWEVRDTPIGILGTGPFAVDQALLWRQWSDDVTLLAHTAPTPGPDAREQLAARGIALVEGEVAALDVRDDRLAGVRLADGTEVSLGALVAAPFLAARIGFLAGLGITPTDHVIAGHVIGSHVAADANGATGVAGVWVAGNTTALVDQVIGAVASGVRAGAAVNADLVAEETRDAVAARAAAHHGTVHGAVTHHGHDAHHEAAHPDPEQTAEEHWDARYGEKERLWTGEPNAPLVKEVTGLAPGRALDLGCGEGGDAVWLALQGWRVTAVDVSRVALDRAARHAEDAGVGDLIEWRPHNLALSFPEGTWDLVSASFLHSTIDLPREEILRAAAAAVAPGGVLLVVGHSASPAGPAAHAGVVLPTPDEVLAALRLPEGDWEVLRSEEYERVRTGPDGTPMTHTDQTVKVRRLPA